MSTDNNARAWVGQHFRVERWRGAEADIRCPLYDDQHASASINIEKRVWKCQGCGAFGTLTDLARELGVEAPVYGGNGQGRREVARYDYRNAGGKLLYQKIRYEPGKDGRSKDFLFFNPATEKYTVKGLKRVPYRLPEFHDAEEILIAEGEKCVEVLRKMGYVATCHDGGAGTPWRQELSQYFPAGTKVYLLPDADNAGQAHMQDVGKKLLARGCQVHWVDLGFPVRADHGKDIADWAHSHGRDDLDWKLGNCPVFEPGPEPEDRRRDDDNGSVEPVKDYGHAAVLAPQFRGHFRWAPHRGSWMRWTGKVWKPEENEYVGKVASDTLRTQYGEQIAGEADKATLARLLALVKETCIYARITGALNFLKGWDDILTRAEQWDSHPWLLNVGNGVLDLKTGKLGPHDPNLLLTKLAPVDYDPEAAGDTWTAHIQRFLPNENVRRQVQRDLGMALVGAPVDELLPIWYGLGANGKSTTANIVERVLGDYAGVAAPNLLIQAKSE
jgi:putative DNA primase/helicase